jgi:hypothetical protein
MYEQRLHSGRNLKSAKFYHIFSSDIVLPKLSLHCFETSVWNNDLTFWDSFQWHPKINASLENRSQAFRQSFRPK